MPASPGWPLLARELEKHHKRLSQGGGLESRLLYCISAPDTSDSDPFAAEWPDYGNLIDRLRWTLDLSRSTVLDRTDPISREILLERATGWQPSTILPIHEKVRDGWKRLVRDRLPRTDDDSIADLWVRGEVQVVRLAAAYAIGTASDTVNTEHVRAAVAVWRYCAESAEILFGIGPGQGGGVDRAFGGNAPPGGAARVLGYLTAKGHIEYRAITTRGRTKHEYRLTPPGPQARNNGTSP